MRIADFHTAVRSTIDLAMCLVVAATCAPTIAFADDAASASRFAEIRVVDAATGRGVPLVELETVHGVLFVTDNAGRVALNDPDLLGRDVYFQVRGHGYERDADGFGFRGARVVPRVGEAAEIKLRRTNVAERLARLTGAGRYRDSLLLGRDDVPPAGTDRGGVAGQDSVQAAVYRDRVHWFWGDTQRLSYPLGMYRTAGAVSDVSLPADPESDPALGIDYQYFVDDDSEFVRAMIPMPERSDGVIWIDGVCAVPDEQGREKLVAHYSRRKGLEVELEHGIAVYNDRRQVFEFAKGLPLEETWRRPSGHSIRFEEDGRSWILFGNPSPNVRVPATLADVLDPSKYEAFTCAAASGDDRPNRPALDAFRGLRWRWQTELPPVDSAIEAEWIRRRFINADGARFCPQDANRPQDNIRLHSGTVRWNAFRNKWILIACQVGGGPSHLGEVWYSEADQPTGPFAKAVRIATHDRQSFYNVCHHAFLDRDGGRMIHFEGTYTHTFSGNPHKTPRYEYNQVIYRLDLNAAELKAIRN